MFGLERTLLVFKFSLLIDIETGSHSESSFNNVKDIDRAKARDTATSMNMAVDLDTDLTYENTTEKVVVVVSPLSTLVSDQMERWKSLKSAKKVYT